MQLQDLLIDFDFFAQEVQKELAILEKYQPVKKDILIVVKDQLHYVKDCVESVRKNTKDYELYIWDNGSGREMQEWLSQQSDLHIIRSEENIGFIKSNNHMAKISSSPYIILLNSDTIVKPSWDESLIAMLQQCPEIGEAGFQGGLLNDMGQGVEAKFGRDIDYLSGWCICFSREIYNKFGLFDEVNLAFIYAEDSDFSLRLQEAGLMIYGLRLNLVEHFGQKTISQVVKDKPMAESCKNTFSKNHVYLKKRWLGSIQQLREQRKVRMGDIGK